MAQHTPGPWEAGPNPKGICSNEYVVRPAGEFPHGRWVADCGMGDEESVANARLIAAAPEMLAALKEIVEAHRTDTIDAFLISRIWALAAKAEGC